MQLAFLIEGTSNHLDCNKSYECFIVAFLGIIAYTGFVSCNFFFN